MDLPQLRFALFWVARARQKWASWQRWRQKNMCPKRQRSACIQGLANVPIKTCSYYWGYIQQMFEGDVQNPQKGTFTNPCVYARLTFLAAVVPAQCWSLMDAVHAHATLWQKESSDSVTTCYRPASRFLYKKWTVGLISSLNGEISLFSLWDSTSHFWTYVVQIQVLVLTQIVDWFRMSITELPWLIPTARWSIFLRVCSNPLFVFSSWSCLRFGQQVKRWLKHVKSPCLVLHPNIWLG